METFTSNRRVLVVTGASSGIGREIARQAARQGFSVIAVARRKDRLDELTAEIVNDGGVCVPIVADVTQRDTPQRIVETARTRFARLDVIVNNAGFATGGALLDQNDAQIDGQWNVHVAAPLRIVRAALPLLRERKGQVFFIGSGLARVPSPYYGAYSAAKAAIRAVATQLRRELRRYGIAVTYVDPGAVQTEFMSVAGIKPQANETLRADPKRVSARILAATRNRPSRVNAVPLHTFGAMLGEWLPFLADLVLAQREPPTRPPVPEIIHTTPLAEPEVPQSDFERALEPVARRMERVKLPQAFLAELLRPGNDVQLSDAAMRWAGMPNKNERAALAEALEALTAGGFLERTGEETWRVVRAP